MKKLFGWISDVHISIKNLDVSLQVLREALTLARNQKVPLLISGDLNDTKAVMRSEWVKELIDLFEEFSDVQIVILTGNHDLDNKNASSNSLYFTKNISNVTLFSEPGVWGPNGTNFYIIPYQSNKDKFKACLDAARLLKIRNIIAHQGILGAHMGDYIVDESSIAPEELADFDIVLLGHYHKFQTLGVNNNITYCGSPFTVNFGESEQTKFIHLVSEVDDGKFNIDHQITMARRHIKHVVESDEDFAKLPTVAGSLLQVVLKGPKEFVRKYNDVSRVRALTLADSVSIVPEISRQSEHRISAEILHSPLKVIDTYLESAETILSKQKLKEYLFSAAETLLTSFNSNSSKNFQITRATAKNFLSFKDLDFTYTAMGLTLVEGYDEDKGVNTGAGKSSFFDVIVYGLFGQTSKDIKADEVINRIAKKDCEINIYFRADDGEYLLKRYRKHSKYENDLVLIFPSGKELRGKDNRETQKLIEQELGSSFDLFLKSSYFTQFGAIDRFLSASDTDKKKLISEITDLSIYDNILVKIKDSLKVNYDLLLEKEKALLQSQTHHDTTNKYLGIEMANGEVWHTNHTNKLNDLTSKKDSWIIQNESDVVAAKSKQLAFAVELEEKISNTQKQIDNYEQGKILRIDKLKEDEVIFLTNKQKQIEAIETKITEANEKRSSISTYIVELQDKKAGANQFTEDLTKINTKLDLIKDLEAKFNSNKSGIQSLDYSIAGIETKIKAETSKLHNGENGSCFNCHQDIAPELIQKVIDTYKEEIAGLASQKDELVKKQNNLAEMIQKKSDLEKEKESIRNEMAKLQAIDDVLRAKNNELTTIDNALIGYANQKDNLDVSKSDANYKIQLIQQEQNPFSKILDSIKSTINPHGAEIERLSNAVNPYIALLDAEVKQVNPFIESVKQKEQDLKIAIGHVQAAQFDVNCVKMDITYGEWWKQALHVYIKSYLMDSCLDQINDHTNEYLQTLFDGVLQFNISATTEAGKDTKEKIDISIINDGDECSYQSLSGGERCRICLAVNLALSNIIAKTNGKNFGMIFLDEILNGLDETGKAQSMKLLKELESQYASVFIIDHADGFKSLFTNSIMIKKKDKISFVV